MVHLMSALVRGHFGVLRASSAAAQPATGLPLIAQSAVPTRDNFLVRARALRAARSNRSYLTRLLSLMPVGFGEKMSTSADGCVDDVRVVRDDGGWGPRSRSR
jgi:hypothetical protein